MLAQEFTEKLKKNLDGKARVTGANSHILLVDVPPEELQATAQYVLNELHGRFITSAGTDKREIAGCFEVNQIFGLDREKLFMVLRSEVEPTVATIPSITPLIPGANWAEREVARSDRRNADRSPRPAAAGFAGRLAGRDLPAAARLPL